MPDGIPDYELDDVLELTTADQVAAIGNLARFRILETLSVRAATVTQLAAEHDLLKGSASHHLKTLAAAGLVRVVRTAKVRGGTERYWGRVARTFDVAPTNPAHGRRGLLLRTVTEDLDAAPPEAEQQLLVTRLRLDAAAYQRLSEQIAALVSAAEADQSPDAPIANLTVALYRTSAVPHRSQDDDDRARS
ncbi:Helix-turn-helix domain-containing protein [Quadrisphaera granulorum]|uniref:Helix-turn-helix protein n=1 Tax=Quadrisphaera granulorum TaxID=317664 RepID=A0A315ZRS4_9ACTN|nr:winged helix-turn-helix domain-containing protein [Quadrisphaera granulorum]PWJ47578.1 helix-turn-helix protein [Quadrisphaera granulorum]SZE98708.1 Helix-turn-helix domain-containing protein [Quadrisphaera granulorum]